MLATNDNITIPATSTDLDLTDQVQKVMGWHFRETSREHPVEINLRAASKTGQIKVHVELGPGQAQWETFMQPMLFADHLKQYSSVGVYVEIVGAGTVEGHLTPA